MSWTRVDDVRAAFAKRWRRGDLLRVALGEDAGVALRIILKGPTARELSERFVEVRAWIDEWRAFSFGHVEWLEKRDRVVGAQSFPAALSFDSMDRVVDWLGYRADVEAVCDLVTEARRRRRPAAVEWLLRRPFQALELAGEWAALLDVADWLDTYPQSGLYARQVDIPGVHSKFIERHAAVLKAWVGAGTPPVVDVNLGLRLKPIRLRFRVLDSEMATLPGVVLADITLDAANFARLELPVTEVFITENEINFLAFPERKAAVVLFGAGYGWSALAAAHWLHRCRLYYWGDIDTHGFAILDGLRASFPHAESFLMDRQTLMDHALSWGVEGESSTRDLTRLSVDEAALYDELRLRQLTRSGGEGETLQVRFEQERVGFGYLTTALAKLRP